MTTDSGDGWPLIADDAVLACEPGDITTLTVDDLSSLARAAEDLCD